MKIMSALIETQKNLEGGEERNLLQLNMKYRYQPHVVILAQKLWLRKTELKMQKFTSFKTNKITHVFFLTTRIS